MADIRSTLIETLKTDDRLTVNGSLAKNKVIELALQLDSDLLKLLLSSPELTETFFKKVGEVTVFDKNKFQSFVSNKQFLPDSFTEYKNKIGLTANREYLTDSEEVVLSFPYKDCVLEGGQTKEDAKRNEVFWNETLAPDEIDKLLEPKILSNLKRYSADGIKALESFSPNENLLIKGNNLLALHSIKERYSGKVKLIYIDPPFNTNQDSFQYNDSFRHSSWLTFMKNRLKVALELLSPTGFIFLHIDQNEEAYIKVLMDEIFGRSNYINSIAVRSSTPSGVKTAHKDKTIIKQKDNILVYRKTPLARLNPQYKKKEKWDSHFNYFLNLKNRTVVPLIDVLVQKQLLPYGSKLEDFDINNSKHREFYLENADLICQTQSHKNSDLKLASKEQEGVVRVINEGELNETMFYNGRQLTPLSKSLHPVAYRGRIEKDLSVLLCDFWDDIDFQNTQNEGGVSLTNGKKPEELLHRIISLATNKEDIVLDFFAGSGTTLAVALKMQRQFIGIEQMDYAETLTAERLAKVINGEDKKKSISAVLNWNGGSSFVYGTLNDANHIFVNKINLSKNSYELLNIWQEMKQKAFLSYKINPQDIDAKTKDFQDLSFEDQQRFLISILDKNLLYVPYSEIDDKTWNISEEDKKLNHQFYSNL